MGRNLIDKFHVGLCHLKANEGNFLMNKISEFNPELTKNLFIDKLQYIYASLTVQVCKPQYTTRQIQIQRDV